MNTLNLGDVVKLKTVSEILFNSDYDFMISKGALRGLQFMDFIFDLEDIFKTHIDVILDTDKTCYALDSAIKDGILIYERQ